jgi:hypothetical protein
VPLGIDAVRYVVCKSHTLRGVRFIAKHGMNCSTMCNQYDSLLRNADPFRDEELCLKFEVHQKSDFDVPD